MKKPARAARLPIAPSGFFAFRTPLLPASELTALGAGLEAASLPVDASAASVEAALAADQERVRGRLRELLGRPEIREAIFVASPSLDESMGAWLEQPASERGQKVERTLMRYLVRMAGRSTPFGLFAGCSVGTVGGPATRLTVEGRAAYQRHTRLDMDYVCALTEGLARDPGLRPRLTFRPNSSLYRVGDRLRYAEGRIDSGAGRSRSYHLVAVDATDYLDATLARAAEGARPAELAAALAEDPEIALEEAKAYVDELIDNQVLVPDLEPAVTGPEPIHGLVDALAAAGAEATGLMASTRDAIDAIDRRGVGGNPASAYRAIAASLEVLPAPVELPRLFQVDMVKPAAGATLGDAAVRDVIAAVELLHRMSGWSEVEGLRQFREKFGARYETREVPLVEALDEESGIGFERTDAPGAEASPLLEGLVFGGAAAAGGGPSFGARDAAKRPQREKRELEVLDGKWDSDNRHRQCDRQADVAEKDP